ncbi:MAG: hypothetical protein O7B99_14875 [Planctomycetota bacterium]|nr:hypothetical protein [Planctomycetota bacterium]
MKSPPEASAIARLVETLIDSADPILRDRILLETLLVSGAANAAAIWRPVPDPSVPNGSTASGSVGQATWKPVLARGPEDVLPSADQVEAVIAGELDDELPLNRRVVVATADPTLARPGGIALALGGVDDDQIDVVEALLVVWLLVEAGECVGERDPIENLTALLPSPLAEDGEAAGLAFDLNCLLAGIRTSLDVLQLSGAELDLDATRSFERIVERGCRRAADLIASAFGSPTSSEHPAAAVAEAAESRRPAFEALGRRIDVAVEDGAEQLVLAIRASAMGRVTQNLLASAHAALARGGTRAAVTCRVSHGPEPGLVLVVENDGPGLPADVTLRSEDQRGLALVEELVSAAGGHVRVRNTPHGARVECFAPVVDECASENT